MDGQRLGAGVRTLRRRRHWRQRDLGAAAGVSQQAVSRIERGRVERVAVERLERVAAALDARLVVRLAWRGGELDRLMDERHAALVEAAVARLTRFGWDSAVEVSYSEFGERGSIDILGWFAVRRVLLVIEVKSTLTSLEETNRRHDQKVRLAGRTARKRFGWQPLVVARVLVLPDEATARRRVARHVQTFGSLLPTRGRAVIEWLRQPTGAMSGILFLPSTQRVSTRRSGAPGVRVRRIGGDADRP